MLEYLETRLSIAELTLARVMQVMSSAMPHTHEELANIVAEWSKVNKDLEEAVLRSKGKRNGI